MVRSLTKGWLSEFLLTREIFTGPNGKNLYWYNVDNHEYEEALECLVSSFDEFSHPVFSIYWSALFCLFVSEKYRREYGDVSASWSWSGFELALGINLTSSERAKAVKTGLTYWKRPVRKHENGYDYLGSLFDEGGLPWHLLQSETHGFGRAVRGAVASYYRVKQLGGDISSTVSNYSQYFPQTFRTYDKYLLIASIVEWLMELAETYPIASVENPADYLDEHASDWRKQSPLPVSENNARNLVNEWLKDAGKSSSERKRLEADEKNFTCEHWLQGSYESWVIETEIFLPSEIKIELEGHSIQSTRLEIAFYEGDSLLKRSGVAHGKVNEERTFITVKISSRVISVLRSKPELPLTVQFLSNGCRVHASYFENSELDYVFSPMVFIEDGDRYKLVSTASTIIPACHALVRVPQSMNCEDVAKYHFLGNDHSAGKWINVSGDITLTDQSTKVVLRFDPNVTINKPALTGDVALYDTLPNLVYKGWPSIKFLNLEDEQKYRILANGSPLQLNHQKNELGSFNLCVLGKKGEILFRKKVGVIPKDLKVMSVPATSNSSARIIIESSRKIFIQLMDEDLRAEEQETSIGYEIKIEPLLGRQAPAQVRIALVDGVCPGEAVTLRLPYPKVGVQLFGDDGIEVKSNQVSLDKIIEMSMMLTSRLNVNEVFYICMELMGHSITNIRRYYPFKVNSQAQKISLYAFYDDIQQMLGASSNQDAFVRIRVETDRILKQFDIVRYTARLEGPKSIGHFEVFADALNTLEGGLFISGMQLDNPQALPIKIAEKTSQGVGVGKFEIPPKMMKNGPWLLFPPAESSVKFRPSVWVTEDSASTSEVHVSTLHSAAKTFHPVHNPRAFDQVIAAMAGDFSHSGWDYLRALKEQYSALPLSAFESWKALANNASAIAAAVFRLEFDPTFCRRLSNELAVVWETVNVQTWIKIRAAQRDFLVDQGIPEYFSEKLVEDRINSVASIIPCFMHLSSYLKEPKHVNLKQVPYVFAKMCFEDLRRHHADDQRWPEWFKVELTNWVHRQEFPAEIRSLPDVGFSRAVAFLPVFMAAMTAGRANFTDLTESLTELKFAVRVLSDFDRDAWYEPTYSLVLSNLLLETKE